MNNPDPSLAAVVLLLSVLCIAVWTDMRRHRIPNWLTGGGMILALVMSLSSISSIPPTQFLLGSLVGLLIYLPLYSFGKMGAGDVKLMAFCGSLLGLEGVLWTAFLSTLAGGILATVWLLYHAGVRELFYRALAVTTLVSAKGSSAALQDSEGSLMKTKLPYASAILCGASIYVWRAS